MMAVTSETMHSYLLVPLSAFAAGITMSLMTIQIFDRMTINGSSAHLFIVSTLCAYFFGGLSLYHGTEFYF
jgi:hypothetical protein